MTWHMACNLLTGLLVRVHKWPTIFCRICNTLCACNLATSLLEIDLLYIVSQDQTVYCEVRHSRLHDLTYTKSCPAYLVPQLCVKNVMPSGQLVSRRHIGINLYKLVWKQEMLKRLGMTDLQNLQKLAHCVWRDCASRLASEHSQLWSKFWGTLVASSTYVQSVSKSDSLSCPKSCDIESTTQKTKILQEVSRFGEP